MIGSGMSGTNGGHKPVMQSMRKLTSCDFQMSPEQREKWDAVQSYMAWAVPGFQYVWTKMLAQENKAGRTNFLPVWNNERKPDGTYHIPVAATDGQNVILNPDTYFNLPLQQCAFANCHEILHAVCEDVQVRHVWMQQGYVPMSDGTRLPFEDETFQQAADFVRNGLLVSSQIGQPLPGAHLDKNINGSEKLIDIYQKVYTKKHEDDGNEGDDENGPSQSGDNGQGGGEGDPGEDGQQGPSNPGGFDVVCDPGAGNPTQSISDAAAQHSPAQWRIETQTMQELERQQRGSLPAHMARMFESILKPEVYWLDHIETLIKRGVGSGEYDWREPDPWFIGRDIYLPRATGAQAGWIVIWGDTSGSRSDAELASNLAELAGMLDDVAPSRLTVIWCDADIDYIDEITDPMDLEAVKARGSGGGGGTSYAPVRDWIDAQIDTPDLFIAFTDGVVDFPDVEPRYPVIWASSTDNTYPFGQVVRVNKKTR